MGLKNLQNRKLSLNFFKIISFKIITNQKIIKILLNLMVSSIRLLFSKLKLISRFLPKITLIILNEMRNLMSYKLITINPLRSFLKSIVLSLQETIVFLKYKKPIRYDKQYSYVRIKKRAHHLEKILMFPKENDNAHSNQIIYNELNQLINDWNKQGYENTASLKWASKIVSDYENFFPENCPDCRINLKSIKNEILVTPENLLNLMKSRRSRRFYSKSPLDQTEKDLIIEASLYAPCSCNKQTVRYIFIEDNKLRKFISQYISGGRIFLKDAPTIIIVIVDLRDYRFPDGRITPFQDGAAAISNLLLMAETMNLACCWCSFTSHGEIKSEIEIRKKFKIPDYFLITGAIGVGHKKYETFLIPRDEPKQKYSINQFIWENN